MAARGVFFVARPWVEWSARFCLEVRGCSRYDSPRFFDYRSWAGIKETIEVRRNGHNICRPIVDRVTRARPRRA